MGRKSRNAPDRPISPVAKFPPFEKPTVRRFTMTYPDPHNDRITNPDDPYDREWGTGTAVTVIVAILIMAGIVAYEASMATGTL